MITNSKNTIVTKTESIIKKASDHYLKELKQIKIDAVNPSILDDQSLSNKNEQGKPKLE